jgi:hypothetical protein
MDAIRRHVRCGHLLTMQQRLLSLRLGLLVVGACALNHYAYAPVTTTNAELEGLPAAVLAIPPESPRGELRLTSLGLGRTAPPSDAHVRAFRALYIRLFVSNWSGDTWTIDESAQRIELEDHGPSITASATTPTRLRPPVVEIGAGKSVSVDLTFAFPVDASEVPRFDVIWTVNVGSSVVSGRTPFRRRTESGPASGFYVPFVPPDQAPGNLMTSPPIR